MAQNDGQRRATDAVAAEMARRGWNKADLAAAAEVDYGTISDFLAYERRAQGRTQAALERALGWSPGTYRRLALGAIDEPEPAVGTVTPGPQDEWSEWLTRTESELTDGEREELWRESLPVLEALKLKVLNDRQRGSRLGDT